MHGGGPCRGKLDRLHERIAGRFGRAEPRARVREYVCGLVAALERKNGWTLAEHAGEVSPDGMQRLLRRADWDVDGVRDDIRAHVIEQLGDRDGVLIADDTGFLKKGTQSAGVQRQYSGTAGRTENCQVGVLLAYASRYGHALTGRALYLPRSWTDDPERCRAAGIPEEVEFAAKPAQAQAMIARAVAAGVPFAWFTADETYGQAKWLQAWLEEKDIFYVMAIRCSDTLTTPEGEQRADDLIAALPSRVWQMISAGAGAHGPREYDWVRVPVRPGWKRGRGHWLLARRSLADPEEIACYACYGPRRSSTADLAWTAGSRWHAEEAIQQAKGEAGPGQYQVRTWRAWHAHITLSMLALAWLAASKAQAGKKRGRRRRAGDDRLHRAGDPPAADQPGPAARPRPPARVVLVPVAPTTPVPGPDLPLPAARLRAYPGAVARNRIAVLVAAARTRSSTGAATGT
jgi:SRSO17 transposase